MGNQGSLDVVLSSKLIKKNYPMSIFYRYQRGSLWKSVFQECGVYLTFYRNCSNFVQSVKIRISLRLSGVCFVFLCPFSYYEKIDITVRWSKWLTFQFHTTSRFRIQNSEFRIRNREVVWKRKVSHLCLRIKGFSFLLSIHVLT